MGAATSTTEGAALAASAPAAQRPTFVDAPATTTEEAGSENGASRILWTPEYHPESIVPPTSGVGQGTLTVRQTAI